MCTKRALLVFVLLGITICEMTANNWIDQQVKSANETKRVRVGAGVLATSAKDYLEFFSGRPAIPVADIHTYRVVGKDLVELWRASGIEVEEPILLEEDKVAADYRHVRELDERLGSTRGIAVAVGAGTVNDLTKLASHHCKRPYVCVATAASMDGYTAYGASITQDGCKQTFYCPAPVVVIADTDIIRNAPEGMNASGYADLLAKVTAGADWMLADALGIEPLHAEAWRLTQDRLREWVADPEGLRMRKPQAIERLMEGLIACGLGMQAAKSSRPASGAEHLYSHLWDMQNHQHQGWPPSHGFKVGIGMLDAAKLYEKLLNQNPQDWNIEQRVRGWPEKAVIVAEARAMHREGFMQDMAAREVAAKYIDSGSLRQRLELLQKIWPELSSRLKKQLLPAEMLQAMLTAAGAASEPIQIGISKERLESARNSAHTIRQRYTILDLRYELAADQ